MPRVPSSSQERLSNERLWICCSGPHESAVAEHEIYLQPEAEFPDEVDGGSSINRGATPEGNSFPRRGDLYLSGRRASQNVEMYFHEAAIYLEVTLQRNVLLRRVYFLLTKAVYCFFSYPEYTLQPE